MGRNIQLPTKYIMDGWMDGSTLWIHGWMDGYMIKWICEWIQGGWTDRWMDGCVGGWLDRRMIKWTCEWIDGGWIKRMDRRIHIMDGWMDGWVYGWECWYCKWASLCNWQPNSITRHVHLPKSYCKSKLLSLDMLYIWFTPCYMRNSCIFVKEICILFCILRNWIAAPHTLHCRMYRACIL